MFLAKPAAGGLQAAYVQFYVTSLVVDFAEEHRTFLIASNTHWYSRCHVLVAIITCTMFVTLRLRCSKLDRDEIWQDCSSNKCTLIESAV